MALNRANLPGAEIATLDLLALVGTGGCLGAIEFILAVGILDEAAQRVIVPASLLANLVKLAAASDGWRHQVNERIEVVVVVRVFKGAFFVSWSWECGGWILDLILHHLGQCLRLLICV